MTDNVVFRVGVVITNFKYGTDTDTLCSPYVLRTCVCRWGIAWGTYTKAVSRLGSRIHPVLNNSECIVTPNFGKVRHKFAKLHCCYDELRIPRILMDRDTCDTGNGAARGYVKAGEEVK